MSFILWWQAEPGPYPKPIEIEYPIGKYNWADIHELCRMEERGFVDVLDGHTNYPVFSGNLAKRVSTEMCFHWFVAQNNRQTKATLIGGLLLLRYSPPEETTKSPRIRWAILWGLDILGIKD